MSAPILSPFPKEQTVEVLVRALKTASRRLAAAQEQVEAAQADAERAQLEIDELIEALIEVAK